MVTNKEAVRRYRAKDPVRFNALTRAWAKKNSEHVARYSRTYHLRRKGFTENTHALVLDHQKHACAICVIPFHQMAARAVHADHDHQTGQPRGVLCHFCNVGLGVFRDSPALLASAAKYLAHPPMKEITVLEPKVDDLTVAVRENTAVLREFLARLTAPALTATSEAATPPKPDAKTASTSRTAEAVNKPAADALAKKDEATAKELTGDAAPAGGDTTTYDDVKRAILEVSKAKGRDAAIKVLAQFGATKGPDLQSKPETFGPFVTAAKAVIGG